jgi:hypothetical protein
VEKEDSNRIGRIHRMARPGDAEKEITRDGAWFVDDSYSW